jgi:hypothetical protein
VESDHAGDDSRRRSRLGRNCGRRPAG